jgi:hypothetical protein
MDTVPEVEEAVEAVESDMPALEATDMPALEEPVLEEDAPDGEEDPQ